MQSHTAKIEELKKQLLDLGYHTYQLDGIIKEAVGRSDGQVSNVSQAACVIESLEDYLFFALKCKASSRR